MSSAVIQVGVPTGFRPKAPHLHRKAIAQTRVHSRRNSPACFHPVVSGTNRHFNSRKRIESRASMGRIGSLPTVRGTLAWKQMQPKEGGHACSNSAISSSSWERSWTLGSCSMPAAIRPDRGSFSCATGHSFPLHPNVRPFGRCLGEENRELHFVQFPF